MPLTPDQIQNRRGHPTAPGARDESRTRAGINGPNVDGVPGVPLPKIPVDSHADGLPGHTTTGPMQPGSGIEENAI